MNSDEKWTTFVEEKLANDLDGSVESQLLKQLKQSEENLAVLLQNSLLPEEQSTLTNLQNAVQAAQQIVKTVASRFRKLRRLQCQSTD